jgi:hypothetical protein
MEIALHGSLSCTLPSTLKGTIFYISGGWCQRQPASARPIKQAGARRGRLVLKEMTAELILFPLDRRRGKIRATAQRLLATSSDRHADYYRGQVGAALERHLSKLNIDSADSDRQLARFWQAVAREEARLSRIEPELVDHL